MAYLEVANLRKSYGAKVALDDVSFSTERSEILCVVGPSGAGKSTLLKALSGMTQLDGGSIRLEGKDLIRVKPHQRGIGLVPQDFQLFPHLNVFENVAFGLRIRRKARDSIFREVSELLERMEIPHLADRRPSEISGGQAQRVALARALAVRPAVVLLDEPLAHVEPALRQRLERLLVATQREWQVPFLVVTHSREEALAISDRLILLSDGRIAQTGGTRSVFQSPETSFAAVFLGYETILAVRAVETVGEGAWIDTQIGRLMLPMRKLKGRSVAAVTFLPDGPRLFPSGMTGENVFNGSVKSSLFRGLDVDLQIELEGSRVLIAVRLPEAKAPEVGERVTLQLNPDKLVPISD